MKSILFVRILIIFFISLTAFSQKLIAQANCSTATALTSSVTCSSTGGNLQGAVSSGPAGACGGATTTTTNGVWFRFTPTSSSASITISGLSNNSLLTLASTYVEVLSGTCASTFTSIACQDATTPLSLSGLSIGIEYFVRVYITGSTTSGGNPVNRR